METDDDDAYPTGINVILNSIQDPLFFIFDRLSDARVMFRSVLVI